jgi:hypothetical protein
LHFGPHGWNRFGLIIDVVGAALLSAEAVRLENLRRVKKRLRRLLRGVRAAMGEKLDSAYITRQLLGFGVAVYLMTSLFSSAVENPLVVETGPSWTQGVAAAVAEARTRGIT